MGLACIRWIAASLLLSATCCAAAPVDAADTAASIQALPFLDSSTSAQPLTMVIACERAGIPWHWRHYRNDAGFERRIYPGPQPQDPRPAGEPEHPITRRYRTHGTHGAYVALLQAPRAGDDATTTDADQPWQADLVLVARAPSEDEIAQAAKAGIVYDFRPVALDAFVFIAHKSNSVDSLTLGQIRRIYTGRITRWTEVGGPPLDIMAFRRDASSGSEVLMKRLVMKGLDMPKPAPHRIFHGMAGPINTMDHNEAGLAYTVYFYEKFMAARRWPAGIDASDDPSDDQKDTEPRERMRKVIAINGVKPTFDTIAARRYPLTTPVYVVIRRDTPAGHRARELRDWLLSPAGQQVVAASGYVPIALPEKDRSRDKSPAENGADDDGGKTPDSAAPDPKQAATDKVDSP